MSEKVLIVARDFAPHCPNPGWMVRAVTLASFLARRGVATRVLATARAEAWPHLDVAPGVAVDWIRGYAEYYTESPPRGAKALGWAATKALRVAVRALPAARLIDVTSLDVPRYLARAERIIRDEGVANVIVTSPPHSLQVVGVELKRRFGDALTYIADLRDPWLLRRRYRPASRAKLEFQRSIERAALTEADHVAMVSAGMLDEYGRLADLDGRAVLVENGFGDVPAVPPSDGLRERVAAAHAAGKLAVGFFGSGAIGDPASTKDLHPIIDAIGSDETLRERLLLVLYGSVRRRARALNVEIHDGGNVSNATARANMRELDVGLVVYSDPQDASLVLGGKIYDYIASGLPLWFVAPANATSFKALVERTGKPLFSDIGDAGAVRRDFARLVAEHDAGTLGMRAFSAAAAAAYSRDAQYEKLLPLLRGPP